MRIRPLQVVPCCKSSPAGGNFVTCRAGEFRGRATVNEDVEEHEAPVLTEEGAALLAKAVARHKESSAKVHDRRRDKDSLRNDPDLTDEDIDSVDEFDTAEVETEDVEIDLVDELDADPVDDVDTAPVEEQRPARIAEQARQTVRISEPGPVDIRTAPHTAVTEPTTQSPGRESRTLVALAVMMVAGVLIIGFAAWSSVNSQNPEVETEVAAAVEENESAPSEADETVAEATDNDVAGDEGTSAEPTDVVPSQEPVAEQVPAFTLGDGIGLSLFDSGPVNAGTRSFAIRVSNAGDEEVPSTDGFGIEIEVASGERIPAFVRFIHQEIPSGSSAIATVRAEGVPEGPSTVVLVFGGDDVDAQELP